MKWSYRHLTDEVHTIKKLAVVHVDCGDHTGVRVVNPAVRATVARALRFDYRTTWFAAGRSALALATASELLFTDAGACSHLWAASRDLSARPSPRYRSSVSGDPSGLVELRWWLTIGGLLLVATGYRPGISAFCIYG